MNGVHLLAYPAILLGALATPGVLVAQGTNQQADESHNAPGQPVSPPEGSVVGLISDSDYPADARDLDREGSTTVRLHVDTKGAVTRCTIVESSGFSSLDAQTCRLLSLRAKFKPARDALGRATSGTTLRRINWNLKTEPMPNEAWAMRMLIAVEGPTGAPQCKVEAEGALAGQLHKIWDCGDAVRSIPPEARGQVPAGVVATFATEERFIPAGASEPEHSLLAPRGGLPVLRQVMRLKIDQAGTVAKCELVGSWKAPEFTPDDCPDLDRSFIPKVDKDGKAIPFEGTIIVTNYVSQRPAK